MKLLPKSQGIGYPIPFKFDLKMRLAILCLFIPLLGMHAKPSYAQKTISLHVKDVTVLSVLESIEKNSDYRFVYKIEDVDLVRALNLNVKKEKIPVVLDKIFKSTDVDYKILGNQVFLNKRKGFTFTVPPVLTAKDIQQIEITGTVTDENGVPIPGVNITVEGTSRGTSTDFDGNYVILADRGETLRFSSVGFEDQTMMVADQTQINISLKSGSALDEVVVTAFGRKVTRNETTSSVSSVSAEDISKVHTSDAREALKGKVTGMVLTTSSGSPGAEPEVRIRGQNSITASNDPLYIIDGVPINSTNPELGDFTTLGIFSLINSADIENISVLKDAFSSSTLWRRWFQWSNFNYN